MSKPLNKILEELKQLGPFWEKHKIVGSDGTMYYGDGRCKEVLYADLFNKYYNKTDFENKTILDIGCNAGGNLIELSKFGAKHLTGVDYSDMYINQCKYMMDLNGIKNCTIFKYSFRDEYSDSKYAKDLGKFDVIFCLGVIYHCRKKTVQDMLKFFYNNGKKVIMSSQDFNSAARPNVDWDISQASIEAMVVKAGFSGIKILESTKDTKTRKIKEGRTNTFYFEALH